jgi:Competence-damaged protein
MDAMAELAAKVAQRLKERRETIAIGESSTGGLISAALLAVPGASAYFLGGAVVYTRRARVALLGIGDEAMAGIRSACASGTAPPGVSLRPAPPDRPATAMATRQATPASPSVAPCNGFSR